MAQHSEKKIRCCGEEERLKKSEERKTDKPRASTPIILRVVFPPTCFFAFCVAKMACGATLKRSMEFEALLSPQSPKRRRCNPLPGTPSTPSPQRCNLRPPVDSPTHSMSPQSIGGEHRLTPGMDLRPNWYFFLRFRVGVMGEGVWVEWNG